MKRRNAIKIGEALQEFIQDSNLGYKLKEVDIIIHWKELMGVGMGKYTRKIYLEKGVLYVEISSPVVKSELIMIREELRKQLNEKAGTEVVNRIVFR